MQFTRLTAIRHGETAWNVDARLQGHLDIPLNATGHAQAARLAQALAPAADAACHHGHGDEPLAALYSSDLARARDTAAPIARAAGLPLHTRADLRERCFADLQGQTFAEVQARQPALAESWRRRAPDWAPPGPGGESLLAFRQRVLDCVQALCAAHLGQHIAIVTHGGVLDVLYRAATGLGLQDARSWRIDNASINRLLWSPDSGLSLIGWADTQHLPGSSRDERTL